MNKMNFRLNKSDELQTPCKTLGKIIFKIDDRDDGIQLSMINFSYFYNRAMS